MIKNKVKRIPKKPAAAFVSIAVTIAMLITMLGGPDAEYTTYFPIFPVRPNKKGLAWSHMSTTLQAEAMLGLSNGRYMNWGSSDYGRVTDLLHMPMLWSDNPDNITRLLNDIGVDEAVTVLSVNEPDRPDQADMTEQEIVDAMFRVEAERPLIKWVSPSYSNAQSDCLRTIAWWRLYIAQGGSPDKIAAWGFHIYQDGRNMTAGEKVNQCYDNMAAAGLPYRDMWVTEIGVNTPCLQQQADDFKLWVEELILDSRVLVIMAYAPYANAPFCSLLTEDLDELSLVGIAYRDAGKVAAGYP